MKKLHKKALLLILLILVVAGIFFAGSVYVVAYSSYQTPTEVLNNVFLNLKSVFSPDCSSPKCLSVANVKEK